MSFKSALTTIAKGVKDLSELNVMTYSGDITSNIANSSLDDMLTSATASGTLKLVGATTMSIDGDVRQFISDNDTVKESLITAHFSAVQASQRSRKAVIDMFTSSISESLKGLKIGHDDE